MGSNVKQNYETDKRRHREITPRCAKAKSAILSVLSCIGLLTGVPMSIAETSSNHGPRQNPDSGNLWKLAEKIAAIAPFHANEVENLLHVTLVADKRLADTYESLREKAASDLFGIRIERVLLKRTTEQDIPVQTILGVDVEPICVSPDALREHFHADGALHVISVNGPLRTAVTFKQVWGEIAFKYKEECIYGITFTST